MMKVTMIDFSMEYMKLSDDDKYKHVIGLCRELEAECLEHLSETEAEEFEKNYVSHHRCVVSSRNYLSALYLSVSCSQIA